VSRRYLVGTSKQKRKEWRERTESEEDEEQQQRREVACMETSSSLYNVVEWGPSVVCLIREMRS
jgi:hypothetical protein